MSIKTIPMLLAIAIAGPALASCGAISDQWSYTKNDAASFAMLEGNIKITNKQGRLVIDTQSPIFKSPLTTEDIKVFDLDRAIDSICSRGSEAYLDYQTINNNSVSISQIETEEDLSGIDVTFQANENINYAALINKRVSSVDSYIICKKSEKLPFGTYSDAQLEFEEEYISRKVNYKEGADFLWSILTNAAYAIVGLETASPTAIASGVIGISSTIFKQLNSDDGPGIPDVMQKLDIIDKNIEKLSEKIDKNTQKLIAEDLYIEAKIDEGAVRDCNASINAFTTDYVVPMENFIRDFGDYTDQYYKSFIQESQKVDLYLEENEDGKLGVVPLLKENPASQTLLEITLENFPNSKKFLQEHMNIVEEGFMTEFYKDIDDVLKGITYPSEITPKDMRNYVAANVLEHITKEYFVNNHQKALDARNMMINLSNRIDGKLGSPVVADYINRLQYMYNFGSEVKKVATHVSSNLLDMLDKYITIATEGCAYAETSNRELRDAFVSAKDYIQSTFDAVKEIPDSYCFTTQTTLSGGFYRYQYDATFTNKGNHPTFHGNVIVEKVTGGMNWQFTNVKASSINYFDENDHTRVKTRLNMLRSSDEEIPDGYLDYLISAKAIPQDAMDTYNAMHSFKWVSGDGLRIITGLRTRSMSSKDTFNLTCKDAGNDGAAFFEIGWKGKYQSRWDAECWSGTVAETNYLDVEDGTVMSDHRVCAYARFTKTCIIWLDDEFWSFVDNPYGNYMFMLSHN